MIVVEYRDTGMDLDLVGQIIQYRQFIQKRKIEWFQVDNTTAVVYGVLEYIPPNIQSKKKTGLK